MKRFLMASMILFLLLPVSSCGEKGTDPNAFYLYLIDEDSMDLKMEEYDMQSSTTDEMLDEAIYALGSESGDAGYVYPLSGKDLYVEWVETMGSSVTLDFEGDYYAMSTEEEVLFRAAIVKTLVQIPGVTSVSFKVNGEPLADASGDACGPMWDDSFVVNPGAQFNSVQEASLTLYFSNAEGNALVAEERNVYYVSSIPMAKLIAEQLEDGPTDPSLRSTIPSGTHIISATVTDGVCYVNFDDGDEPSLTIDGTEL